MSTAVSKIFAPKIVAGLYLVLSARSAPEGLALLRVLSASAPDNAWVFGILAVPVVLGILAWVSAHDERRFAVASSAGAIWWALTAWNWMTPTIPSISTIDAVSGVVLLWALVGTGAHIARLAQSRPS